MKVGFGRLLRVFIEAGQQQVRNIHSNEACFNLNLWMYSLVEAWAWDQAEECVCDRSASPWVSQPRRPSHNGKRKSLQREVLRGVIREGLSGRANAYSFRLDFRHFSSESAWIGVPRVEAADF